MVIKFILAGFFMHQRSAQEKERERERELRMLVHGENFT